MGNHREILKYFWWHLTIFLSPQNFSKSLLWSSEDPSSGILIQNFYSFFLKKKSFINYSYEREWTKILGSRNITKFLEYFRDGFAVFLSPQISWITTVIIGRFVIRNSSPSLWKKKKPIIFVEKFLLLILFLETN